MLHTNHNERLYISEFPLHTDYIFAHEKTRTAAWSVCANIAAWPASGQASAGLTG